MKQLHGLPLQQALLEEALRVFEPELDVVAAVLVGSVAKGSADRVSDLDLLLFTRNGFHRRADQAFADFEADKAIFHRLTTPASNASCFRKYLFEDLTSAELHLIDEDAGFPLCPPYAVLFDKAGAVARQHHDKPAPEHSEATPYSLGDQGLLWELFNCIKWLSRGESEQTKRYLRLLAAKLS